MSVETRTRRTPTGDRSSGFDETPALSMVKVPSDPAQVIVNHASFRVQLGASARRAQSPRVARQSSATHDGVRMPVAGAAGRAGAPGAAGGRRRPVVWSGRSAPDDSGAHRLLQAVRSTSVGYGEEPAVDAGATQVIPRVGVDGLPGTGGYDDGLTSTIETPVIGGPRGHGYGEPPLLPHMRSAGSAYDEPIYEQSAYGAPAYDEPAYDELAYGHGEFGDDDAAGEREHPVERHAGTLTPTAGGVRHAYYPGRRMNLGVVLLPLRIFLGSISVYAGMGKLCDPVYFDGGERGSMVKWLNTLHPWEAAEPLRQFGLQHPVGTGLVIAFLQVIVGVLTVLGLWQRVAATLGALLSAALIVTVSWKTSPAYDTPDIIYLAAWSPLVIAGAPVYSVDGRLAGSAWRRLGPRSDIWELRLYVLRRGALMTALVTGLTLLIGSLLGGAVRDADRVVVPGPGEAPRNELPGSPLPKSPEARQHKASPSASQSPTQGTTSSPSSAATTPGATGAATGGRPSQTQGTVGQAPSRHSAPAGQAPSTSAGPSSSGGSGTGGPTGGASSGGGGGSSGGSDHLVGGLLG
ncbi:DoxX family protein [Streptomyces yaanensis]|uniref:DoxX family protein n=1 Tax=Streptomyces yaanensis TaxID=1142239 RepID=A0ABV7S9Y4_9ACTN|nr:DoxX family protein [Streptomyces sp. CGMCC 4.7035]WNC02673.1 DoxX family protein [Streptomyces sp. CGMCC 4.7035]